MRRAAITLLAAVLAAPILLLGSPAAAQNDYVEVTETTVAEQPEAVRGEVVAPQVTDEPQPAAEPARAALPVTGSDASLFVLGGGAALALAAIARRMARHPAGGS